MRVNLVGELYVHDGYAGMLEYTALGMARLGADVNLVPLKLFREGLRAETIELLDRSTEPDDAPLVFNSWVRPELERYAHRDHFIFSMWESSRLPVSWVPPFNRARALMVPTRFVAQMCRDSGVTVPVEVMPEGIDPEVYPYLERPDREFFTTLVVGTVVPRKHVAQAIAAWQTAFEGVATAHLVIKARFGDLGRAGLVVDDSRVSVISDDENTRGILHWYQQADVLLALGSEGFGLPLVEGMATGLPVIALSSEGQGDVCSDAGDLVLATPPTRWEDVHEPELGYCGVRGVPDVDEVARLLRWVAAHRDEARDLGRQASEWAHKERNIWAKPALMLDVLRRHS